MLRGGGLEHIITTGQIQQLTPRTLQGPTGPICQPTPHPGAQRAPYTPPTHQRPTHTKINKQTGKIKRGEERKRTPKKKMPKWAGDPCATHSRWQVPGSKGNTQCVSPVPSQEWVHKGEGKGKGRKCQIFSLAPYPEACTKQNQNCECMIQYDTIHKNREE